MVSLIESCKMQRENREPISCTPEVMKLLTDNFKKERLIGITQFGYLFRAKIPASYGQEALDVTVKIWIETPDNLYSEDDESAMIEDEVKFLTHPTVQHHPNLVNLIAFCNDREVKAVVYDSNPLDSLYNYILRGDFTWIQRIRVALGLANLLNYLHGFEKPYTVSNVDSSHIMIDPSYNPLLFDVGVLSGGSFGEMDSAKTSKIFSPGYFYPYYAKTDLTETSCDVYSYGVILLGLITKRINKKENVTTSSTQVDYWFKETYTLDCSLVHSSLMEDEDYHDCDGIALTKLVMQCISLCPGEPFTMKDVLYCLQNLCIAKNLGD